MKPSFENNDKPEEHPAPGTLSNASTDTTLVWDNVPENNLVDDNRNFTNTLTMSTNGDLNKAHTCMACCCSCEHSKCTQCISKAKCGYTNIVLDLTNDDVLDSLENGFEDDKNPQDDDFDDRELCWTDFDIRKYISFFF